MQRVRAGGGGGAHPPIVRRPAPGAALHVKYRIVPAAVYHSTHPEDYEYDIEEEYLDWPEGVTAQDVGRFLHRKLGLPSNTYAEVVAWERTGAEPISGEREAPPTPIRAERAEKVTPIERLTTPLSRERGTQYVTLDWDGISPTRQAVWNRLRYYGYRGKYAWRPSSGGKGVHVILPIEGNSALDSFAVRAALLDDPERVRLDAWRAARTKNPHDVSGTLFDLKRMRPAGKWHGRLAKEVRKLRLWD